MSLSQPFRHALPVDELLFHEPLYLTHAGWEQPLPGAPYPQNDVPLFSFDWQGGRTLPEFCLALVVEGGGEFQTRLGHFRIHANEAFLYRPGEWHRHRPTPQTGWTLMWIHFNGNDPVRWLRDGNFALNGNFPIIEKPDLFRGQLERLLECVHKNPAVNSANFSRQAVGLLSHFLTDAPAVVRGTDVVPDGSVQAAIEYIWNFGHNIVDVTTVARKVGIGRRTLDRRFKAATGRTVLEEIQFCRITRAARLLRETDMPIKHIVHRAGFRSSEHLRLAFHKAFGKSPQSCRGNENAGQNEAGQNFHRQKLTRTR